MSEKVNFMEFLLENGRKIHALLDFSSEILFRELSMNTNPFYQDRMSKKL